MYRIGYTVVLSFSGYLLSPQYVLGSILAAEI